MCGYIFFDIEPFARVGMKDLERDYRHFLLASIILYGPSDTGKTTLILDILKILLKYIPNVLVYSPTALINGSFDGVVPRRAIISSVTIESIEKMYRRQERIAKAYKIANDMVILENLFKRVATGGALKINTMVKELRDEMVAEIREGTLPQGARNTAIIKIKKDCSTYLRHIYRTAIGTCGATLKGMNLSQRERVALKYLHVNPYTLVIFDDCASFFSKKMQNEPVIKDLFFMFRHVYGTCMFTGQDDTNFESYLRKNAMVSGFTDAQCASSYFERSANSFSKQVRAEAATMIDYVFSTRTKRVPEFTKLFYIRKNKEPFRKYLAQVHEPFRFGSAPFWKLCEQLDSNPEEEKELLRLL